jgi:hypothetical protein
VGIRIVPFFAGGALFLDYSRHHFAQTMRRAAESKTTYMPA